MDIIELDKGRVEEAEGPCKLVAALPQQNGVVDQHDSLPSEFTLTLAAKKVYGIVEDSEHSLNFPVSKAVKVLEKSLEKYELENLYICFNGGKDCTVLLHLFYAVVQKHYHAKRSQNNKLNALCIRTKNSFVELERFVEESCERYQLNMCSYNEPIKSGLEEALNGHPEMKAVLMGTRRTDPSGKHLDYFQMTDSSWPQLMRISPLLDWSYEDVWTFLRLLSIPYCPLYNQGYTSIGSQSNSFPNPALRVTVLTESSDENEESKVSVKYRPAYELDNSVSERVGRK